MQVLQDLIFVSLTVVCFVGLLGCARWRVSERDIMWLPWMEFAAVLTAATLLTIPMGNGWRAALPASAMAGWSA
jgi:hypothetical protein